MSEGEGSARGTTAPLTTAASEDSTALLREFSPSQIDRLAAAVDLHDSPPTKVGPYRIVRVIGEGGMGVVYLAEQLEPIRRTVALKLIKLGMDTRQVIARFESERQALAVLNHPNVAKVLDAGTTETGRPYFVMEYVPGEPITGFCDHHHYTNKRRLELFTQACEAVQHAHQKAIIHRDLKPSNILVMLEDGKPLVKVIDFGVAKATAQKLTERTLFTEAGQLIGTPEYMSPEQAELTAIDVDTRSDIYSLGVVLYELLTGALPFDPATLRASSFDEIRRIIREVDPPRPSTRLSSLGEGASEVAIHRQTQTQELTKQLRSELEWIPLKAMRKDRAQRYATATQFALDVANYLDRRPLIAGPESKIYRLRKFLRRNKGPVAAVAAIVLTLLAGVIGTTGQMLRAMHHKWIAETLYQQKSAEQLRTQIALAEAWLEVTKARSLSALVHAMQRSVYSESGVVSDTFETDAHVRASLAALAEFRRTAGEGHPAVTAYLNDMGRLLLDLRRFNQAADLLRDGLARARQLPGDNRVLVAERAFGLGAVLLQLPDPPLEELGAVTLECWSLRRQVLGDDHLETVRPVQMLTVLRGLQGRHGEGVELIEGAIRLCSSHVGEAWEHRLGECHGYWLLACRYRGADPDRLESAARMWVDYHRDVNGSDHWTVAMGLHRLALVLRLHASRERAVAVWEEAESVRQRSGWRGLPLAAMQTVEIGQSYLDLGEWVLAEPLVRQGLAVYVRMMPEHWRRAHAMTLLGESLAGQGRFAEAEPLLLEGYERLKANPGVPRVAPEGPQPTRQALERIVRLYVGWHTSEPGRGYDAQAAQWRARLAALVAATQPATQPATGSATGPS